VRLGTLDGHHDLRQGAGDDVDAVAVLGVEMDGGVRNGKKWWLNIKENGNSMGNSMGIIWEFWTCLRFKRLSWKLHGDSMGL
jgi:hypothetical protein